MKALTSNQRACLASFQRTKTSLVGPDTLATFIDTSREGAAATASSLVRRGYLERVRVRGHVYYRRNGAAS